MISFNNDVQKKRYRIREEGLVSPLPPDVPLPLRIPQKPPSRTLAGDTGPALMDLSASRWRISAEERAKRFTDGRCLYCGGFNHKAADCVARKKAQTFKVAGAKVREVGTGTCSEELGKEQVN